MAQTPVAAQIHQALDVHRHLAAQVALDLVIGVDVLAHRQNLGIGELVDALLLGDARSLANLLGGAMPDSMDIGECDMHPLVGRNVNACDARHVLCSVFPGPPVRAKIQKKPVHAPAVPPRERFDQRPAPAQR